MTVGDWQALGSSRSFSQLSAADGRRGGGGGGAAMAATQLWAAMGEAGFWIRVEFIPTHRREQSLPLREERAQNLLSPAFVQVCKPK